MKQNHPMSHNAAQLNAATTGYLAPAAERPPDLLEGQPMKLADNRLAVLVLTWLAGHAGHETGDYLVQDDWAARNKQCHTRPDQPIDGNDDRAPSQRVRDGRRALARHAVTYGVAQAVTKALAYRAVGLRVPMRAQLAGVAVETTVHALIDDGRLLRTFAEITGKLAFHDLAAAGVNGRALMDQAGHKGLQIPLGAIVTTLLAGGAR
ncbi:hypothetical protein [Amycolatopsis sacchari]|uniref:hypothetical protein n=1 Tax=Amycolatopsis sacchari TaxID=115433 RepID=UPI003D70A6E1